MDFIGKYWTFENVQYDCYLSTKKKPMAFNDHQQTSAKD